jgi:N-acetylmuramoyl-L-alanine amidase
MHLMNKRLIFIALCAVTMLFGGYQLKQSLNTEQTFSKADIKYGATGKDVYELQGRLKFLGYYYGKVDGDFGYKTLGSVKWFQSQFGLKVDGIVGDKTKLKLWEATKNWRPTAADLPPSGNRTGGSTSGSSSAAPVHRFAVSEQDINLMANAVHGESRGEPYIGQVAVAAVILNRVESPHFPNTIPGVIFQPGAFTAVADGQIWLTPDETSKRAVRDALNGWDPSGNALYYFNPATATSKWIWSRPQIKQIGKHIFCR